MSIELETALGLVGGQFRPKITGTLSVGNTLTCSNPGYAYPAYQWLRNGTVIPGATASTYVLKFADMGADIECAVTGIGATAPSKDIAAGAPVTVASLPAWTTALNAVRAGTGRAKIKMIGDSTTAMGSYTRLGSYPTHLATQLAALGYKTENQSAITGNRNTEDLDLYDPRLTFSEYWFRAFDRPSAGGGPMFNNTVFGDPYRLMPETAFNVIEVWYYAGPGYGDFTVAIDGVIIQTIDATAGANTISKAVINVPGPPKVREIGISRIDAQCAIHRINPIDTTSAAIEIINMGWSGATASSWAVASFPGYESTAIIDKIDADLHIINLGINDWYGATTTATYKTHMQTIINACKLKGDVILAKPVRTNGVTDARINTFRTAIDELCATNTCPTIDFAGAIGGSWAAASAAGRMDDDFHQNSAGSALIAQAIRGVIIP